MRRFVWSIWVALFLGVFGGLWLPTPARSQGSTFYVATTGRDDTGTGSAGAPWATITHAITSVPDGSTIVVRPGSYAGRVRLDRAFAQGIVVRSELPYQAQLRHTSTVVTCYYGQGITLEGFDIAHSGPGASALVIQIQDLIGTPGGSERVSRITLRNNVIHDSYNNDIVKINNGASDITVEGNIFYNQAGSDEHIDVNSVTDVVIQDNIFFNDFAGSGRTNANDTSAFVVIKDSNGTDDSNLGSRRINLRRNIFLGWEGSPGYGFVQIGEDGTNNYEASDVRIENNLMLGDSANPMRAPVAIMGSRAITLSHTTVVGDLPANAFALRLYTFGSNQPNTDLRFSNNIWSDALGTMTDFSDSPSGQTAAFVLDNNLYWNANSPIPQDATDLVNSNLDTHRRLASPALPTISGVVRPRWVPASSQFADGSPTIRQAFLSLVSRYGRLPANSAAIAQADPAQAPTTDIRGVPRPAGQTPDIGAYERPCPDFDLPAGISVADLQRLAMHWGQGPTTAGWEPQFDLDGDLDVDGADLMEAAAQWGGICP